jgi:hypothetical protein
MSKNTGQPQDRLPKKNAMTRTVLLANDSEIGEQYRAAKQRVQLMQIRSSGAPDNEALAALLAKAQEELDEIEPQALECSIKFVFQSIGRKNMEKLVLAHPPTEEQLADVEKAKQEAIDGGNTDIAADMSVQWNYETFTPALVARSMVQPLRWSEENDQEILDWLDEDGWNTAEIGELFSAALQANNSSSVLQMGKESRKTTNSA